MKPSTCMRALLALAIASSLAACGGSRSYILGGTVSGLTEDGLVLSNSGETLTIVPSLTTTTNGTTTTSTPNLVGFSFPNKLAYGTVFNVIITGSPPHQNCTIASNTGSAGTSLSDNISISCFTKTYLVSGSVTGYTGTGLIINNGSDTVAIDAPTTGFTFTNRVAFNGAYGVTILQQPLTGGQTCSVVNGVGKIPDTDVTNVVIACQ